MANTNKRNQSVAYTRRKPGFSPVKDCLMHIDCIKHASLSAGIRSQEFNKCRDSYMKSCCYQSPLAPNKPFKLTRSSPIKTPSEHQFGASASANNLLPRTSQFNATPCFSRRSPYSLFNERGTHAKQTKKVRSKQIKQERSFVIDSMAFSNSRKISKHISAPPPCDKLAGRTNKPHFFGMSHANTDTVGPKAPRETKKKKSQIRMPAKY